MPEEDRESRATLIAAIIIIAKCVVVSPADPPISSTTITPGVDDVEAREPVLLMRPESDSP